MPNLRYKYIMNEPFVNGESDMYKSSHAVNLYKERLKYEGKTEILKKGGNVKDESEIAPSNLIEEVPDLDLSERFYSLCQGTEELAEFKRISVQKESNFVFEFSVTSFVESISDIADLLEVQTSSGMSQEELKAIVQVELEKALDQDKQITLQAIKWNQQPDFATKIAICDDEFYEKVQFFITKDYELTKSFF